MQNTGVKKRADQEDVDSDYLFDNFLRLPPCNDKRTQTGLAMLYKSFWRAGLSGYGEKVKFFAYFPSRILLATASSFSQFVILGVRCPLNQLASRLSLTPSSTAKS